MSPFDARILIQNDRLITEIGLTEVLRRMGCHVETAASVGIDRVQEVLRMAREFRPHLIVMDPFPLAGSPPEVGIWEDLASSRVLWFSDYHDLRVVPYHREVEGRFSKLVTLVGKGEPSVHEVLAREIERLLNEINSSDDQFPVEWIPESSAQALHETLFHEAGTSRFDLPRAALSKLFPQRQRLWLRELRADSSASDHDRRSSSCIFLANQEARQPSVLRFAPAYQIIREYENYSRLEDEGELGAPAYAHLEEYASFWDCGVAKYSLLGWYRSENLIPFTQFYLTTAEAKDILGPLNYHFSEVWGNYAKARTNVRNSLFSIYDASLHISDALAGSLSNVVGQNSSDPRIRLPDPISWTRDNAERSYVRHTHRIKTHGNFGSHVLLTDGKKLWALDYSHVVTAHVLNDFAALEVDIVTQLATFSADEHSVLFETLIALVSSIAPHQPELPSSLKDSHAVGEAQKTIEVIAGLRELAQRLVDVDDFKEYAWALLFWAVRTALSCSPSSRQQRAILYGSLLCERLNRWGEQWPPEQWAAVRLQEPPHDGHMMTVEEELQRALMDAFGHADLEEMLLLKLEKRLDEITDGQNLKQTTFELVREAQKEGWMKELVQAARRSNPGNPHLLNLARRMGLAS